MTRSKSFIKRLTSEDFESLSQYLVELSDETKGRFGPHGYDLASLQDHYADQHSLGFLLMDQAGLILGYSAVYQGFLEHDRERLSAYGLKLSHHTDATFAPSIADPFQGKGLGKKMFHEIVRQLRLTGISRLILWGGVQLANPHAVNYYRKLGFSTIGQFEYHGWNFDMVYEF